MSTAGHGEMIISRTPYRISLAGGGTDLPAFYQREPGSVISLAINRYIYVALRETNGPDIRVRCGDLQVCRSPEDVKHDLVREALVMAGASGPLDITVVAELPWGTGLGSSSVLAVGLMHALYDWQGKRISHGELARLACGIEIDRLQKPIGRQDQYSVAYGGIKQLTFDRGDEVGVRSIEISESRRQLLESHMLLVYTGWQRRADEILQRQVDAIEQCLPVLREMGKLAHRVSEVIGNNGDMAALGALLHEGWLLKRSMGFGISDFRIDAMYETAREAGAYGGRLLGAGGGGFMLFLAPPDRHEIILDALGWPRTVPVVVDPDGSKIVAQDQESTLHALRLQCES